MRSAARSPLSGYAVAIVSTIATVLIRQGLGDWGRHASPFLFVTPAVMISAWYGGLGPGLLATFTCVVLADIFLLPPYGAFTIDSSDVPRFVIFILVGVQISWFSGALRKARERAEADADAAREGERLLAAARQQLQIAHDQLEARVKERTAELHFQKSLLEAQSNASLDGIMAVAEDSSIIFCNHRLASLWDLPPQVFAGSLADAVEAMRPRLVDHQDPLSPADSLLLRDGHILDCYSAPVRGGENKIYGRVWFFRDITESRRILKQVFDAQDRERQRIGQDLHDDLCQHLTGISCLAKALQQRLAARLPAEETNAADVVDLTEQAIQRARDLARGLQPAELNHGLDTALAELARHIEFMFAIHCEFHGEPMELPPDRMLPIHLYRIAQEAINNAIRHGHAGRISMQLGAIHAMIVLRIEDDGVGIDPESPGEGVGLRTMRHRARMIGAVLTVERGGERGTIVSCRLPRTAANSTTATLETP
ncbi:MAG TPA: DUF4118 domain-containing protein [Humisphaera sp.]|jgi:signal transduction histidine kinase|nr:DUF4118 domain-containing protein [Humisphaera sp.]